jgi:hypothetical protein
VKTLDDQEWHIALAMPASEMAHTGSEIDNTPIKQYQDKVWAIKIHQDWPVNIVINNWLLTYKTS